MGTTRSTSSALLTFPGLQAETTKFSFWLTDRVGVPKTVAAALIEAFKSPEGLVLASFDRLFAVTKDRDLAWSLFQLSKELRKATGLADPVPVAAAGQAPLRLPNLPVEPLRQSGVGLLRIVAWNLMKYNDQLSPSDNEAPSVVLAETADVAVLTEVSRSGNFDDLCTRTAKYANAPAGFGWQCEGIGSEDVAIVFRKDRFQLVSSAVVAVPRARAVAVFVGRWATSTASIDVVLFGIHLPSNADGKSSATAATIGRLFPTLIADASARLGIDVSPMLKLVVGDANLSSEASSLSELIERHNTYIVINKTQATMCDVRRSSVNDVPILTARTALRFVHFEVLKSPRFQDLRPEPGRDGFFSTKFEKALEYMPGRLTDHWPIRVWLADRHVR